MKTILMVLASERFRDIEYLVPRAFFEQHGWKVQTASSSLLSKGRFGYEVKNDFILSEVQTADFQGIYMVGGAGALEYLENMEAKKLFETFLEQNKPIAAICAAPRNFLAWGFLNGKMATGFNADGEFV
ncbi:MAG: DJ-1/PfpI family protein, partial [Cytophagales bacterium]|nr:DJ-1/PfpI family protein [Cytophaga sp.]